MSVRLAGAITFLLGLVLGGFVTFVTLRADQHTRDSVEYLLHAAALSIILCPLLVVTGLCAMLLGSRFKRYLDAHENLAIYFVMALMLIGVGLFIGLQMEIRR